MLKVDAPRLKFISLSFKVNNSVKRQFPILSCLVMTRKQGKLKKLELHLHILCIFILTQKQFVINLLVSTQPVTGADPAFK